MKQKAFESAQETGLICLYNTQQILPGLTAVLSFRSHNALNPKAPLAVLVWVPPRLEASARQKRMETFTRLLKPFSWINLVFPTKEEIQTFLGPNTKVLRKADYLKKLFKNYPFTSLFFAHDISADFIAQSAMQAFPQAQRVCFGDALGVVYSNAYFTQITYPINFFSDLFKNPKNLLRNILFRLKRARTLPKKKQLLEAQYTALCIPCDPSGNYLSDKNSVPIDRTFFEHILFTLSHTVHDQLLEELPFEPNFLAASFIMLVGSYSESRLCTEEEEIALYLAVANLYIPPGNTLVLKPHPGSSRAKIDRIKNALATQYTIFVFHHFEIPIEFMVHSMEQATVISFSYASVSLTFLNKHIKVIHALNDKLINQFFSKATRNYIKLSNQLYLEQLESVRDGVFKCPEQNK